MKYLSTAEVAARLGVSTVTVRAYVARGLLVRIASGTFREPDVQKLERAGLPARGRPSPKKAKRNA